MRACVLCGKTLPPKARKYCSEACRREAYQKAYMRAYDPVRSTEGAAGGADTRVARRDQPPRPRELQETKGKEGNRMKVIRMDDNTTPVRTEYNTDITDIMEVAAKYGRCYDRIELRDDSGAMVAVAVWPSGYKGYIYSTDIEQIASGAYIPKPGSWRYDDGTYCRHW